VLCLALLLLAVYWPPLAAILSVVPLGLDGWLLIGGASLVPLLLGQAYLSVTTFTTPDAV
jgi:Ca2+-transporting ATPase